MMEEGAGGEKGGGQEEEEDQHQGFLLSDLQEADQGEEVEDRHQDEFEARSMAHDHGRVIIHYDVDCFYCQVEMLDDPSLRDKPVGIQQKYLIVTCNYAARQQGVTKLQPLSEAKKRCPQLVIINGEELTKYRNYSERVGEVLKAVTNKVERLGFDETFMDATALVEERISKEGIPQDFAGHVYTPPTGGSSPRCDCGCVGRLKMGSLIAQELRDRLLKEVGLTCSAGISCNKMLAKLAGEARKLPGCGWSTSRQLQPLGIETCQDLQDRLTLPALSSLLGPQKARSLFHLCRGYDPSPVVPASLPKQMSEEDSFRGCNTRADVIRRVEGLIKSLVTRIEERWSRHGEVPYTFRLTLRQTNHRSRESRQCDIPNPSSLVRLESSSEREACLKRLALSLFDKMVPQAQINKPFELTLLNVAVTKIGTTKAAASHPVSRCDSSGGGITKFMKRREEGEVASPSPASNGGSGGGGGGRVSEEEQQEDIHDDDDDGGGDVTTCGSSSKKPKLEQKREEVLGQPDSSHSVPQTNGGGGDEATVVVMERKKSKAVLVCCELCGVKVRVMDAEAHKRYHEQEKEEEDQTQLEQVEDVTAGGPGREIDSKQQLVPVDRRGGGGGAPASRVRRPTKGGNGLPNGSSIPQKKASCGSSGGGSSSSRWTKGAVVSHGFDWEVFCSLPSDVQDEMMMRGPPSHGSSTRRKVYTPTLDQFFGKPSGGKKSK